MQVEDGGADLLDHLLQVVDALGEPVAHIGAARPRNGALQSQADREQPLDHVVVQIAGNAVTIAEHIDFP